MQRSQRRVQLEKAVAALPSIPRRRRLTSDDAVALRENFHIHRRWYTASEVITMYGMVELREQASRSYDESRFDNADMIAYCSEAVLRIVYECLNLPYTAATRELAVQHLYETHSPRLYCGIVFALETHYVYNFHGKFYASVMLVPIIYRACNSIGRGHVMCISDTPITLFPNRRPSYIKFSQVSYDDCIEVVLT